jgi:hypothetical protein
MRSSFHLKKLAQLGMFIVSLFCFQSALFAQTPSSYPYFNRIHTVSDSVYPNFYNYYCGGVLLPNDTMLLVGIEFELTTQTYNRTYEFIDPSNGDIVYKKTENTFSIPGSRANLGYSDGIIYAFSRELGFQSIKKFSNPYGNPIWNKVPDAYPLNQDPDFYYEAIEIQQNGNLICSGQNPYNKMLLSIFDTSCTLINKTDLSNLLTNNNGSISKAIQLLNNTYLIKANSPSTPNLSSTGRILILNEDLTWKKQLYISDPNTSSNFFQSSDASIYCYGLKDSSFNLSNSSYTSYIYKFDQDGNLIWKKNFPINNWMQQGNWTSSWITTVIELEYGNLVFIGNDIFKGEDVDYLQINGDPSLQTRLLCISSSGNKIWERSVYTSANNSTITNGAIKLSNDDIVLFGGIQESLVYGLEQKAFVAKVNCLGRMTDMMHNVQTNEQDGLVSVQIEADSFYETTIDWGDGTPSTTFQTSYSDSSELFFVQHQYTQSKPYQMTVSTRGCKDTLDYELVQEAHVPDNNEAELNMYPNPTFHSFTIHLPTNELLDIQITDEFGRLVANYKQVSAFTGFEVDLNSELAGKYHIKIIGKSRSWLGKMMKL